MRSVPTWDEDNPREFEDVWNESRKSGVKVHFGKLMTIASIKFYEFAKHRQKMKGRIVYRGDCAKDKEGAAGVPRARSQPHIRSRLEHLHGVRGFAGECHHYSGCYQCIRPGIPEIELSKPGSNCRQNCDPHGGAKSLPVL